jgi:hypothetical protein
LQPCLRDLVFLVINLDFDLVFDFGLDLDLDLDLDLVLDLDIDLDPPISLLHSCIISGSSMLNLLPYVNFICSISDAQFNSPQSSFL